MTATLAVLVGLGACIAARRAPRVGRPSLVGSLAALAVLAPVPGIAAATAMGCRLLSRRLRRPRLEAVAAEGDVVLLADLVALGLGARLSLPAALDEAAGEVAAALAAEVRHLRRAMDRLGVAAALAAAEGRGERLYRLTARAAATGAPLATAVEAFAAERRHREADVEIVDDIVSVPCEVLVGFFFDQHDQVPCWSSALPRIALALEGDVVPFRHPRGNIDFDRRLARHTTFAVTSRAWIPHDLAFSSAGRARGDVHELPEH